MKAKELMMEDWVLYGRRYAIVKRIEPSRCDILVCVTSHHDDIVIETYDNIDPIPLTTEILKMNGWIYNDEEAKYAPETWVGNNLMLHEENGKYRIVVVSDYDDEDTNNTPFVIQYVHELQHALRLCGLNKMADNLKM